MSRVWTEIHLPPYFVSTISEGSSETVHMRSLTMAFNGRLCDTVNLQCWDYYILKASPDHGLYK